MHTLLFAHPSWKMNCPWGQTSLLKSVQSQGCGGRDLHLPPAWGTLGLHHAASSLVGSYPKVPTKGRMGLVVLVGSLPKVPTYSVLGGVEPAQRFSPDILSGFMVT